MPADKPTPEPGRVAATGRLQCRAQSKQTHVRCKAWSVEGVDLCRHHGGRNVKRSAIYNVTHGTHAQYIPKRLLPEIVARAKELATTDGRAAAAAARVALTEKLVDSIPEVEEYYEVRLKGEQVIQSGLKLQKDLDAKEVAVAMPVFQVADYSRDLPFSARGAEGLVTIQLVGGRPYIRNELTGGYDEAVVQKDVETGADIYVRVLTG